MSYGLQSKDLILLAVWRMDSDRETLSLPIPELAGRDVEVDLLIQSEVLVHGNGRQKQAIC